MEKYLKSIDNLKQHSTTSLIFYSKFKSQKYECADKSEYVMLSRALAESLFDPANTQFSRDLYVNLLDIPFHQLIFILDVKCLDNDGNQYSKVSVEQTRDLLFRYFDLVFLQILKKYLGQCLPRFTTILTMRRDGTGGLHVHLPEVEISHDDYEHLCKYMRCESQFYETNLKIELDCPSIMYLVGCGNSYDRLFVPVRFVYVHFEHYFDETEGIWKHWKIDCLNLSPTGHSQHQRKTWPMSTLFPNVENKTLFESLLDNCENKTSRRQFEIEIARYMMPVGCHQNTMSRLIFKTQIISTLFDFQLKRPMCNELVATFVNHVNDQSYKLYKSKNLTVDENEKNYPHCLSKRSFAHHYLENYAIHIGDFQTYSNDTLNVWYKMFRNQSGWCNNDTRANDFFPTVNDKLRAKCYHLRREPNPLKTVMTYRNGFFFWPVFYSLCNLERDESFDRYNMILYRLHWILLGEKLDNEISDFLSEKRKIDILHTSKISRNMTLDTIAYCAFKINGDNFFDTLGKGWSSIFSLIEEENEAQEVLETMLQTYFPIVKGKDPISKTEGLYYWDPILEKWQSIFKKCEKMMMERIIGAVIEIAEKYMGFDPNKFKTFADPETRKERVSFLAEFLHLSTNNCFSKTFQKRTEREIVDAKIRTKGANVPQYYFFENGKESLINTDGKSCKGFFEFTKKMAN